jgi:RES domain-containing protein
MTALLEYQQTSALLPPCTICSYVVVLSGLVDLRKLHTGAPWDGLWQDWPEDWRHLAFDLKVEPPSWVLSDMVRGARSPGIIFPSMVNSGGVNLVLFPDLFGP